MATEKEEHGSPGSQEEDVKSTVHVVDESYFIGNPATRKKLPEWLDHFNAKDLKILFKCSAAVWINTLLIFINPTLRAIGQATFFGCIVLFIAPPSGVIFVHILVGVTVIVGLALGWAWGVIVMKAALATRPEADLLAKYAQLQSIAQNTTNVDPASGQSTFQQIQIFEGFMLDTRVTLTYFCMIGIFVYLVARIRVAAPKLTLVSIFALVVSDIYLTTAPLIPAFQGTIPKTMVLPVSVSVGIGVVCNILFFPQSTSQIVLDGFRDVLRPMKGFSTALLWQFSNPSNDMILDRLVQIKSGISSKYKAMEAAAVFLPMDFTLGCWGPDDIVSLSDPVRNVMVAFSELLQLQIMREEHHVKEEELVAAVDAVYDVKPDLPQAKVGHHQLSKAMDLRTENHHPDTDELMNNSLRTLSQCGASIVQEIETSFDVLDQVVSGTISTSKDPEKLIQKHQDALKALSKVQAEFVASCGAELVNHHSRFFDEHGHLVTQTNDQPPRPPLSGLMVGLLFQERILNLSQSLINLLKAVIELEKQRQKRRFWAPKGLMKLFSWCMDKGAVPTTVEGTLDLRQTKSHVEQDKQRERKHRPRKDKTKDKSETRAKDTARARLDGMRKSTGRRRQKSSMILLGIVHWLSSTEGVFALRVLIVTIAMAVPAVIPASAGFYYREKGLWATIMAQLSLVPYASDFVSGLIIRGLGTVAGGVVGLVVWYIGSGLGPGNPYGLSAIMAVVITIMMWWRLFAPPEQMAAGIMLTSTMYTVVSQSWVDTHIPSYGNPGVGYMVFWRRILLVLIGFTAASLVTFFPKPPSGSRHYRRLLSENLVGVKDRYALFASTWRSPPSDLIEVAEKEGIASEEILTSIVGPVKLTRFEFSTSNIDSKTMGLICHLSISINQGITQLLMYTARLPDELRKRFVQNSGAADENFIGDLMAVLTLVQQSLRTGDPLPAILPTPLLGRSFRIAKGNNVGDEEDGVEITSILADNVGRKYVSALCAFVHLLGSVDDLVVILKRAVGETSDIDLEEL